VARGEPDSWARENIDHEGRSDDAADSDWESVYQQSRAELFRRAGVTIEVPGELAQRSWHSIAFPEHAPLNDITKTLKRLNEAQTMLVRCGKLDDAPAALGRESMSSRRRFRLVVPRGYTFTRAVLNPRR